MRMDQPWFPATTTCGPSSLRRVYTSLTFSDNLPNATIFPVHIIKVEEKGRMKKAHLENVRFNSGPTHQRFPGRAIGTRPGKMPARAQSPAAHSRSRRAVQTRLNRTHCPRH